jgi:glycosyltransferase involved in cell wall biosynthesis
MELMAPDIVVVFQSADWLGSIEPIIGHKPLVIYEHDCYLNLKKVPKTVIARSTYLANSRTTAAHILKTIGKPSTVIPPIFGIERYSSVRSTGEHILFVSLSARKGGDIALAIARNRREHKFIFIETWHTEPQIVEAARQLGNVEVLPNQKDLFGVFPRVRLLLMPGRNQEAWGRTASEAQVCGIPVLASNRGNLPDTIGEGGIALDPALDISHWLSAFDELLSANYSHYAAKAADRGAQLVRDIPQFYNKFVNQLSHHVLISKQNRVKSSFL